MRTKNEIGFELGADNWTPSANLNVVNRNLAKILEVLYEQGYEAGRKETMHEENSIRQSALSEYKEELVKRIEEIKLSPLRTLTKDNPQYDLGWNTSRIITLQDIIKIIKED